MRIPVKGDRLTGSDGQIFIVVGVTNAEDLGSDFSDMPEFFLVDISTEAEAPLANDGEWQLDPDEFQLFCQENGIRL